MANGRGRWDDLCKKGTISGKCGAKVIKNLRISKKTCKICGKREKTHGGLRDGQPQWGALEASAKPFRHSDRGELLNSCVMFVRAKTCKICAKRGP